MQRRTASATSALLQKANSQLKGERVKKPEDELNAYISTLTQKTSQQKKSVNFEDLDESISISSDIEDAPIVAKPQPATSSGSKFLKKKTEVQDEQTGGAGVGASKFLKSAASLDHEEPTAGGSKFLKKPQTSAGSPANAQNRYAGGAGQGAGSWSLQNSQGNRQASSALQKATALTGKIQQKAAIRKSALMESDSDESFNLQMVKSIGDMPSESLTSESTVKVGKDGGKFLKKSTPVKAPTPSSEPPVMSATQKKDKSFKQDTPAAQPKKASPFALRSSQKYSTEVVLNSEEESLAEFVEGLPSSSGDSFDKYRRQTGRSGKRHSPSPPASRHGKRSPSPPPPVKQSGRHTPVGQGRSPSPTSKPPPVRRTPSPSPRANGRSPSPHLRKRSPSPKLMRSYSDDSNVADSLKSEIADGFDLGVNSTSTEITPRLKKKVVIMDLDELAPADESGPVRKKSEKENLKPKKSSLKSADIPVRDYPKIDKSPFKSSENIDNSPFKSSKGQRASSPSSYKSFGDDSPFKAKTSDSPFKAKTNDSPFKSKTSDSPFKSKTSDSPFKSKGSDSPFKSKTSDSPFKSIGSDSPFKSKTNDSPFKSRESSPFKAKGESSPFRASAEGSVFKSSARSSSPFKAADKEKSDSSAPVHSKKDRSRSRSQAKRKEKERKKSKKNKSASPRRKKSKKEKTDIFGSFGLQTVEDLFGDSIHMGDSVKVSEFESIASEQDDGKSELSEEIKTEKPSVYSYNRYDDSASEVESEVGSVKQSAPSYTEDFESISERIGADSVREHRVTTVSEVKTRYSGDETAVDDYTEFSESDTETVTSDSRASDRSEKTYSRSYTSYTDDYSKSLVRTSTDMTPRPRSGMRTAAAQTAFDSGGLHYHWDPFSSGLAFPGMPVGLGFVDPTPIATHVVSADALEAMTAYSPAMLALQDMLKAQLELTREFLQNQDRLYREYTTDIQANYRYTTLEDTKQYIKKHRKKKLTFKEALKLVDQEMGRR